MEKTSMDSEFNNVITSALIHHSNTLFCFLQSNGIIDFMSQSVALHLGFSAQEVINHSLYEFIHKEETVSLQLILEETVRTKRSTQYECKWVHLDQTPVFFDMQFIPLLNDQQQILCIAHNVTSHIQRMETALDKIDQYKLVTEHITDLIQLVDTELNILYASPSYQSVLEFDPTNLAGSSLFQLIHPDDKERLSRKVELLRTSKKPVYTEVRYQHNNGDWSLMEANLTPLFDSEKNIEGIILSSRDITVRKQNEEAIAQAEKLSVIGQMAAGIAHEIRNPLTSLKGFVQLLKRESNSNQHYFEVMLTELDRINFIVSELLVLAKPNTVDFSHQNLHEIINHVMMLLDTQAILNNVQILADFDPVISNIYCAPNHLKQVFMNVIKNSIEAMPHGGIILIKTKLLNGNQICISFQDNGRGIPDELLTKLGEPFFTTKERGSGLGLMVSQKIIKDHRGELHFSSELTKGTKVTITLPFE